MALWCSNSVSSPDMDFVYDLPQLLWLRDAVARLSGQTTPAFHLHAPMGRAPGSIAVLSGSFNPLTRGHEALVAAAWREGVDAALLLLPVRAIDKEGVTRAALVDRALVLLQWAARHERVGVALVNRGLYR